MNYEEFLTYIQKSIQDFYGAAARVSINHVTKNNGIELDGLYIVQTGKNISPTIYLNPYFEEYRHGEALTEIVSAIMEIYENAKLDYQMDVGFFTEFSKVKSKLVYKVINYEKNQELLDKIPHRKILNLALVYYCLLENDTIGSATILIYNQHLPMWGITEEELYEIACSNTQRLLRAEIMGMSDVLSEVVEHKVQQNHEEQVSGDISAEMINELLEEIKETQKPLPMYVLTNQSRMNGAVCMFYPEVLGAFAQSTCTDLYVIPSSVHEVILVPVEDDIEGDKLYEMLNEVNVEQVPTDEVLSNELYYFSRKTGCLDQMVIC